jgi:hypothetical protein
MRNKSKETRRRRRCGMGYANVREINMLDDLPDLEEIEDAVRQLQSLPYSLWPPELRAELAEVAETAMRLLADLHARGLIRITRGEDGIEAELLPRVRH